MRPTMTMYRLFLTLPRAPETACSVAIRHAIEHGIQPYHALLALRRITDRDPQWAVELLARLVDRTSGTHLSPIHQIADADSRRYYLRAISSHDLPYDRALGYAPVMRRAHRIASDVERCDVPAGSFLDWSDSPQLRSGVASHSALVEYRP